MLPISTGFEYIIPLPKCFEIGAGAGLAYTWLKESNDSGFIPKSNSKQFVGGILKAKIAKKFDWVVFALFADYLFQSAKVENSTGKTRVNLSGLFFGGSIGGYY